MSQLSMYNAISILPTALHNLEHVLRTGEDNMKSRDRDPVVILNSSLAPDMWPLKKQAMAVCSLSKNAPYRIAGLDAPDYDESESTFKELYALIARAKKDIAAVSREDLDGKEGREFSLQMGPVEMDFTGISYFSGFTIPNVYFHATTAYNILRINGVPLGKFDFFGGMKG